MSGSIGDAAADLRRIARDAGDASGYFPALYARVTGRLADAIARSEFADGPGMDRFASTFASYYLRAATGGVVRPRCWQACWDVAGAPGLLIVQHLLLGINAHVNHDLALAVVDVADERGQLAPIRADFDAVNDVLAQTYEDVLGDLDRVSRWVSEAATVGGGRAFNFSLRHARRQAWGAAERLHPLDRSGRQAYGVELDRLVSVLAYLVSRPPVPLRPLAWLARRLEERDPGAVVDALLGER
ncbi:MAG: hypothetical protein KY450_13520 [Actinobacteria bacterium]|nr:hypothetical protein [Actinomycetota bacterium]